MERTVKLERGNLEELFGPSDKYLKIIRDAFKIKITARANELNLSGSEDAVARANLAITKMRKKLSHNSYITEREVKSIVLQVTCDLDNYTGYGIRVYPPRDIIEPFTKGQKHYIETMRKNSLTFCSGPAGTGKTYLAVAVAVSMLRAQEVRKIVLVRPAVEAGERLGFLPGDIEAKVNPYLRPLFDSLEDMMEFSQMRRFMEMDIIEVVPLAFMRGRTLNDAAIICDEAQNTTPSQMLMFLTRLGRDSKMIVTGDITQVDLNKGDKSGMLDAYKVLQGLDNVGFSRLERGDIVRHKLVQNIVAAYEKHKESDNARTS